MKKVKIYIQDLKLKAMIGIQPDERVKPQNLIINMEMEIDGEQAIAEDNIHHTLDYQILTEEIIQFVEASQFFLLERLVDEILEKILNKDKVIRCKVKVEKPHALPWAKSVAVEMEKGKPT